MGDLTEEEIATLRRLFDKSTSSEPAHVVHSLMDKGFASYVDGEGIVITSRGRDMLASLARSEKQ